MWCAKKKISIYEYLTISDTLTQQWQRFPSHQWALQRWKRGLIDPKRHFIHSERWQSSLFSKESTLSLLHSSRAFPSAWWIMSPVSSKTRFTPDRYTTLYKMILTACRFLRGHVCQRAIGLKSLSMMRCLRWFRTFGFSSNPLLRRHVFTENFKGAILFFCQNKTSPHLR